MQRFFVFGFAALAMSGLSSSLLAQTNPACNTPAQSYQRFSYQPAPVSQSVNPSVISNQPALGPMVVSPMIPTTAGPAYMPQPMGSSQSYRRYSYQPTRSASRRELYLIPKGDSARYRP